MEGNPSFLFCVGVRKPMNPFVVRFPLQLPSLLPRPGITNANNAIVTARRIIALIASLDFSQRAAGRIQWCLSIDHSGKLKQSASKRWARSATVWAKRRDAPCRSMVVWSAGAPVLLLFVHASPISLVADKAHG